MQMISSDLLQVLLLTYNEQDNIERVLDKLTVIQRVIIIDSFSTDNTLQMISKYPNAEVHFRTFDTFADQCNFGLQLVNSPWVISIDADYVLTEDFIQETNEFILDDHSGKVAYFSKFHFLVFGKKLANDNTTPRAVLFKPACCTYYNDGHAHRLRISGEYGNYKTRILHDDRKPLSRWITSQSKYSIEESEKIIFTNNADLTFISKIRKTKIFAPFFVFFYCLFIQGLIFNGWRGWYYTLQRTIVEMLFALRLIENDSFKNDSA